MKRISPKYFLLSLILVLALALSAGCSIIIGSPPSPSPSPSPTVGPTLEPGWTLPPVGNQPVLPSIADVVAKVKPSVVAINVKITGYDIFNRPSVQEGAGSGWVIDTNGLVITNNHVVEGADSISVTLDDGRTFQVDSKNVATDPLTDLAVLKIDAASLPSVTVGDSSKLRVGDWVVAIGNSLGQGLRATQGIISRKDVSLPVDQGQTLYGLIETDAAINPGNSGGPLVNMAGEVIGITSAKIAASGVEGMGYAIPSEQAAPIIQQLIDTGYVIRPYLGVSLYTVDPFAVQSYGLAVNKGALVVNVAQGSPADKAGLKDGDVITRFAGKDIAGVDDLLQTLRAAKVGQTVEITYWRGNAQTNTSATLIESPKPS